MENIFMLPLWSVGPLALIWTLLLVGPLRRLALRVHLVDQPNYRKLHRAPVPLVGGIAIALASFLALCTSTIAWTALRDHYALLVGGGVLLLIGVIDDKSDIRASLKLIVQLILASLVFDSGIRIESMYGILGIYELPYLLQYLFTLLVITGVVNAFNLMDGIDGLAAGLAIVGLSGFALLAFTLGNTFLLLVYLALIGALLGFLRYNLAGSQKIFMGDAGSLLLGFLLVVGSIELLGQAADTPLKNTALGIIFGVFILPVADSLRVYRRRIREGKSPFEADKTHFHHLVLALGLKHKRAALIIVSISLLLILLSLLLGTQISPTLGIFTLFAFFILLSNLT